MGIKVLAFSILSYEQFIQKVIHRVELVLLANAFLINIPSF